jgi:ATP-dependent DNA helicase PIF1
VLTLTTNMRLKAMEDKLMQYLQSPNIDEDEAGHARRELNSQKAYGDLIMEVGNSCNQHMDKDVLNEDSTSSSQTIRFATIPYLLSNDPRKVFQFLYPNGFDPNIISRSCVLAATNVQCIAWNELIQNEMNTNELHICEAKDTLCEVDDLKGNIRRMLTPAVLERFNKNGFPPHFLSLKVGDVCLILRNMSQRFGLATNTRVRILQINTYSIRVQTFESTPRQVTIPRITFYFKLPFGQSFTMKRIQFPLQLAYCMTYNKSQGQTLDRVVVDITHQPFTHGHLYVILSRVTAYNSIVFFCTEDQLLDDAPVVTNIVYKEVLL